MLVNTPLESFNEINIDDQVKVNEDQYFGFYEQDGLVGLVFRDRTVTDAIILGEPVFTTIDDALIAIDTVIQIKEIYPGFDFRGLYGMPNEEQTLH